MSLLFAFLRRKLSHGCHTPVCSRYCMQVNKRLTSSVKIQLNCQFFFQPLEESKQTALLTGAAT